MQNMQNMTAKIKQQDPKEKRWTDDLVDWWNIDTSLQTGDDQNQVEFALTV